MKDQLIFDTTDANTIADSDKVGAFVVAAGGDLVTSTNDAVNSKERLDVLSVLADEAGNAVNVSSGSLDVNVTNSLGIDVDLDHTEDSVSLGDGTTLFTGTTVGADHGLDVNIINAGISVTQGTSPWVVSATDLDIRDLTAVSDSVQSHLYDGAGTALTSTLVGADQALDVNVVQSVGADSALADTSMVATAETLDVASTSQNVVVSPLTNRKYLYIYNKDNRQMFIGGTGVTEASGFPVSPGSYINLRAGASVDVEFVSAAVNHEIRTLELS